MKIAYLASTFPPYKAGIGNVCYHNAKELAKFGHDVTVFTPKQKGKIRKDDHYPFRVKELRPVFSYGNSAFVPQLFWKLRGFDIIHLNYPWLGGAELLSLGHWLRLFKTEKKKRTKLIIHHMMDVVGRGRVVKKIFAFNNRFIVPRVINVADAVIISSLDYAKHSILAPMVEKDGDKFFEIPNGVDTKEFKQQPQDQNLLRRYGISENDKVIVFVGALDSSHYFKGVDILLKSFSRIPAYLFVETKLIIVGEGNLKQQYLEKAKGLGILDRVVFTGFVPDADLPKIYNIADCVVLPSIDKSESFGIVLVEAMACAKPVIASDLAGVRSVVDHEKNGFLVEPENQEDLTKKLNQLLIRQDLRHSFGLTGRRKAEHTYDWAVIGNILRYLYENLLRK